MQPILIIIFKKYKNYNYDTNNYYFQQIILRNESGGGNDGRFLPFSKIRVSHFSLKFIVRSHKNFVFGRGH